MFSVPMYMCVSAGFVLSKSSPPTSDENSHSWDTKATFQDITYWNHDYSPSQNDELFRAFHWLTVAKAVSHFCITDLGLGFRELNYILWKGDNLIVARFV